jgi:hypothetical protein
MFPMTIGKQRYRTSFRQEFLSSGTFRERLVSFPVRSPAGASDLFYSQTIAVGGLMYATAGGRRQQRIEAAPMKVHELAEGSFQLCVVKTPSPQETNSFRRAIYLDRGER